MANNGNNKEYYDNWNKVKDEMSDNLTLGKYYSAHIKDIKHLMVSMSRYKFVSKLLKYKSELSVLEIGCSEGLGGAMISQECDLKCYVGLDQDEDAINWANKHKNDNEEFVCGDLYEDNIFEDDLKFDSVFSLDVIEHVPTKSEDAFVKSQIRYLKKNGSMIIGTPNITMTPYASEASRIAHINLYDQKRLYELMSKYFDNVFIFGMNDEVVSTGFEPMSCYIFAVCTGLKD